VGELVSRWQVLLRWLLVLPAATAAVVFIEWVMRFMWALDAPASGAPPLDDSIFGLAWREFLIGSMTGMAWAGLAGACAPSHKSAVAYTFAGIGVVIWGVPTILAVVNDNVLETTGAWLEAWRFGVRTVTSFVGAATVAEQEREPQKSQTVSFDGAGR
jgi:hypothetical protein